MSSAISIFKDYPEIAGHPAVQELIGEFEEMNDELIDLKQTASFSKEVSLRVLVSEIQASIRQVFAQDMEAARFGETPRVDFRESLQNLGGYIDRYLEDHRIRL